jgi:hypothetical protein
MWMIRAFFPGFELGENVLSASIRLVQHNRAFSFYASVPPLENFPLNPLWSTADLKVSYYTLNKSISAQFSKKDGTKCLEFSLIPHFLVDQRTKRQENEEN